MSTVEVQETSGAIVEVHDDTTQTVVEVHGSPTSTVVEVQGNSAPTVVDVTPFVYVMPTAQTTATVDHDLNRDPISIQVLDEFGEVYSEFSITYTVPKSQVRVGFDLAIKATIRML